VLLIKKVFVHRPASCLRQHITIGTNTHIHMSIYRPIKIN
jgi:hypothetical protein